MKTTGNNRSETVPVTLKSIAQQKAILLQRIHTQKEVMNDITKEIFAPLAPASNKATAIMRTFNTGMAVFDGVMLGLKLMRKFRNALRKKHR